MTSNETRFDGVEWIRWAQDTYLWWAEDCTAATVCVKGGKCLEYLSEHMLYSHDNSCSE
jgi:hypothetical protein